MSCCICKECHPATGVTLCEAAYLTHAPCSPSAAAGVTQPRSALPSVASPSWDGFSVPQPDLVVVRTNRLEVYRVRSAGASGAAAANGAGCSGGARLELVGSYTLYGVVESLAVLSGVTPGRRDALLLAFRDAKLSVLEWDPRDHTLRTSSMHYFEGDPAAQREGRSAVPLPPRVVTDPAGRCAAMAMYFCHLALLPALEADALDLGAAGGGGGGIASVGNGYMLNLNKMMGIREIRDCCFLHGYTEPVLLLLHEPDPTWVGRLRERKDTCCLTAISISLRLKRHTLLWKMSGLPYDCYKLLAVPYRPSVLVISPNLLLLCSQASQYAAALNSNALPGEAPPPLVFDPGRENPAITAARMAAEFALNVHPDCAPGAGRNATLIADLEAVAAGAAAAWLTPTTCLMGLQSGALLAVHLQFDGPPDQRITAVRTGGGPIATALVGLTMAAAARGPGASAATSAATAAAAQSYTSYKGPKGLMFLGSWTGDSVLMQLRPRKAAAADGDDVRQQQPESQKRSRGHGGDGGGEEAMATNRSAAVAAAAAAFAAAAAAVDAAGTAPRFNLRLLDSLPSLGPVRDLLFADTSTSTYTSGGSGGAEASRGGPTCFLCVGQGQTGAIAMVRQGLIPDVLTEVNLPSIAGVFAVHHRTEDDDSAALAYECVAATVAADRSDRGVGAEDGDGDGDGDGSAAGAAARAVGEDDDDGVRRATVEMTPEPPEVEQRMAGCADGGGDGADEKMAEAAAALGAEEAAAGLDSQDGGKAERRPSPPCDKKEEMPADGTLGAATGLQGGGGGADAGAIAAVGVRDGGGEASAPPPRPVGPPYHAYLLITIGRARTMVLRCAEGLDDVTKSPGCDFILDQPTLAAGNLFHNAVIIQACPTGLRVLEGMSLVQDLPVTDLQVLGAAAARRPAGSASPTLSYMQACDPYVLIGLSDGTALLLEGDPLSLTLGVDTAAATAAAVQLSSAAVRSRQYRVAAACLQRDETGWMAAAAPPPPPPSMDQTLTSEVDDGSADGGGDAAAAASGGAVYLWVCRLSGRLECYSLPSMRLVFQSSGLAAAAEVLRVGPAVMYDMYDIFGGDGDGGGGGEREGGEGLMEDPVAELRVESFRGGSSIPDCEQPVLMALTASGQLLAYQAYNPAAGGSVSLFSNSQGLADAMAAAAAASGGGMDGGGGRQQLAFRRLPLETLSHESPATVAAGSGTAAASNSTALGPRLIRFDNLAYSEAGQKTHGPLYGGVFVAGSRPLWLVAARGSLVAHPMFVEGPVASLTSFHNANCPLGFIAACSARGQLKVCQLPPHTRLDGPWVTRRVALRVTPHRLAWFRDAGLLAAITSRTVPSRPRPPEEPGGDPHAAAAYAAAGAAAAGRGREEAWDIRLLEPSGCGKLWTSALLPPGEQALCLKVVYVQNATTGDTDALLAVGTGCPMGEDYPCLGRILLYSVAAEVADLGGGNLTRRWSAVLVATREMASAVTSVQEFKSQLLITCGSRVEMYEWRGPASGGGGGVAGGGGSLEKRAFFDLPCLVTSLVAVKDYLLAADASQGLYFVRYSDAARVLEFMSKDFDHRDLVAGGVIINEPKLAFLAADAMGSLALSEFYGTRSSNPEFWAGQRLAPLGLLHVARRLTGCTSIKMATADGKNRHALLCGAAEGGLSYIAPVQDPEAAQRLTGLQTFLSRNLPHVAGLNPRAFRNRFCRIPKPLGGGESHHAAPAPSRSATAGTGLLDGQLLAVFPLLSRKQQQAAAGAVGATPAQLLQDLRTVVTATTLC